MKKLIKKFSRNATLKQLLQDEDGFSLIELMVVIVIMGLLTTVVVINVMPTQDRAMVDTTRVEIREIEKAIEIYRMETLRYPTMETGLDVLSKPSPNSYSKEGILKTVPKDPWGNDYYYLIPGNHGPYDVFSFGADGRLGGEGLDRDIGNWIEE